MATPRRPLQEGEIRITHSHLTALGVAMVSSAALAFLLGIQVGSTGAGASAEVTSLEFTPATLEQDELEAMLREVELARGASPPATDAALSFPRALTGALDPSGGTANGDHSPVEDQSTAAFPLADARPAAPPPAGGEVPQDGWSVQVATTRDVSVARARRDELIEGGWPAYVVSSFVDGKSWYRVRVGGFDNAKEADIARTDLASQRGHDDLVLTSAP